MHPDQISNNKIRQVFMLAVIIILSAIILYNLSDFLPSLLGAITLYIISRSWNFKLVEEKGWKPWVAALVIILICLVIIVIPTYFTIEVLVNKISDAKAYTESITQFFENTSAIEGIRKSFSLVHANFITVLVLWLLAGIISSAGVLFCLVGVLFTFPFFFTARYSIYSAICGAPYEVKS